MNYLVFDIGGSSIKYALMDQQAHFINKGKVPTPNTKEDLYTSLSQLYKQFENVQGIGISLPGVVDSQKGYTYTSGALDYYNDTKFVDELSAYIPVSITIGNDAKCAANAEIGFGSLIDVDDAIVLVLGTGIGGCLVKDHKVIMGKHFCSGEASAVITDYHKPFDNQLFYHRCGIDGLLKHVQQAMNSERCYTGEEIFEMANSGNQDVIKGIDDFTYELAIQIFNIHTWFDSERVAIGGGISSQPLLIDLLKKNIDHIYETLKSGLYPCPKPNIVKCVYGNDANLVGALYQHLSR